MLPQIKILVNISEKIKYMIMKKIAYYISLLSIILFATSCSEEWTKYETDGSFEATFPSTIVNFELVSADNGQITIEMWRGNSINAASIPVTITGDTDVFIAEKQQFDFEAGSSKAYLTFTYPDINTMDVKAFKLNVSITNSEDVSVSGRASMQITAQRKLTFESLGTGSFTSELFGDSWPVDVYKAQEADYYRIANCYYNTYHIDFTMSGSTVEFAKQPMGYNHSTYGMISWDPGSMDESSVVGSKITFAVIFVAEEVSFGKFYEELIMP